MSEVIWDEFENFLKMSDFIIIFMTFPNFGRELSPLQKQ